MYGAHSHGPRPTQSGPGGGGSHVSSQRGVSDDSAEDADAIIANEEEEEDEEEEEEEVEENWGWGRGESPPKLLEATGTHLWACLNETRA